LCATDIGTPSVPFPLRALCVSVHDVAPVTQRACERLLGAVRAVADIPVTLLVVPRYHGARTQSCTGYLDWLGDLHARGHELALHGYTHRDSGSPPRSVVDWYWRRIYTTSEGEFAAIDARRAQRLLSLGLAWFARHGWPVHGFIAPAWLLGPGARAALYASALAYTTTWSRFEVLPAGEGGDVRASVLSPSLVYAARNGGGRILSPLFADALAGALRAGPLVRLSLHPRDAEHGPLLLHAQRRLGRLLEDRHAMTKAAFAARLRARREQT